MLCGRFRKNAPASKVSARSGFCGANLVFDVPSDSYAAVGILAYLVLRVSQPSSWTWAGSQRQRCICGVYWSQISLVMTRLLGSS